VPEGAKGSHRRHEAPPRPRGPHSKPPHGNLLFPPMPRLPSSSSAPSSRAMQPSRIMMRSSPTHAVNLIPPRLNKTRAAKPMPPRASGDRQPDRRLAALARPGGVCTAPGPERILHLCRDPRLYLHLHLHLHRSQQQHQHLTVPCLLFGQTQASLLGLSAIPQSGPARAVWRYCRQEHRDT